MVWDGPKPLKSIEKQTLFLILGHSKKQWKKDTKGDMFLGPKWQHGRPKFNLSFDF